MCTSSQSESRNHLARQRWDKSNLSVALHRNPIKMFDQIFGGVFGKSKKSTTTNGKPSEKDESSDKSGNLYPTILLTDQMLKGESGTPPFEVVNFESSSSRTPFKTNDSVIVSSNSRQKAFSPLDNIPFHILSSGSGGGGIGTDNGLSDLNECFTLLNSVAGHLANPSSEYKFVLEKSVIMHSLD